MSFDEAAQIHEKFSFPVQQMLNTSGAFFFAWVIPGLVFVGLFAITFLGFLRALPLKIAAMMVLGGAFYVFGAIGMEMVGSMAVTTQDWGDWAYILAVTVEEACEMFGLALFCAAILVLLADESRAKNSYFA